MLNHLFSPIMILLYVIIPVDTNSLEVKARICVCVVGYNKCVLIGHDWGGMIAWLVAICYPEMVTKLIVVNFPHPSVFTGKFCSFVNPEYLHFGHDCVCFET